MRDPASARRVISPSGLLLTAMCFFLPFFTVSCESGWGGGSATYSGFDFVFYGAPTVTGFGSDGAGSSSGELRMIHPMAILTILCVTVGIALGLLLRSPFARWLAGATATLAALTAVITQQAMAHWFFNLALESGDSDPGMGFALDMLEVHNEWGFWIVVTLLIVILAYNVLEVLFRVNPSLLPNQGQGGSGAPPGYPQGQPGAAWPPAGSPGPGAPMAQPPAQPPAMYPPTGQPPAPPYMGPSTGAQPPVSPDGGQGAGPYAP